MRGGVKDRVELIWSNVAPSRALLGQCSGAGSGLLEESMSLLLTPLKKKESGHHRQCGFYNLLSSVKVHFHFHFQNMPNFIDSAPFVE